MRIPALTAAAVALIATTSGSAAAASEGSRKPLLREPISVHVIDEVDDLAKQACNVEVSSETTIKGQFVLYGDLSARRHLNLEIVFTDPTTGEVLTIERDAFTYLDAAPTSDTVDIVHGVPVRTLVFDSVTVGAPFKARVPGDGVLLRDAGRVSERITIVSHAETGEEFSFDVETLDVRGPHPFLALSAAEREALLCSALTK